MTDNLKQSILGFVKDSYRQKSNVPSLRKIILHFKDEGMSFNRFYGLFPEGLKEACRLAGVPAPIERVAQTSKATATSKQKENSSISEASTADRLVLSEIQARRIFGISQLEGGADPNSIIDDLLNLDTELRSEYHLSLNQIKPVIPFFTEARKRNWKNDELVNIVTQLWNNDFMRLSPEALKDFNMFLSSFDRNYWGSMESFLRYAGEHSSTIKMYKDYLNGAVSLESFLHAQEAQ